MLNEKVEKKSFYIYLISVNIYFILNNTFLMDSIFLFYLTIINLFSFHFSQ